ncbi:alpha/beta hydrolase [Thermoflavimicrobium dichotomicum]|uniref:Enterochelin esterase n=1 Tax=Thermoflavimicrobium dichotomicum TaxID=46223 RepID=A0A1I3V3L5_9BACL|nr:alpha/beta hydrolase-fold protein [Thermoflavimicrobium dichotomicum]SFJ89712.1 Enterochelin esterase [Thermoflavimicrobium dichotomicum]
MEQKQQKRIIKRESIQSQYLLETKEILIYLPPGYDETVTYPGLILHDGTDYFNLGRIATQASQMIINGEIIPLIMVAVPVNKEVRTAEYSPLGHRNQEHQQFIVEELLPLLKERYPIDLSPQGLVIGGSSLGGTASLHLALRYPQHFVKVLSQSGAFLEATTEQIIQSPSLSYLTIYQSIGLSETAVSTHMGSLDLVTRNREIHRLLQEKHAHVHYREKEGDHTWGLWQKDLPEALTFFFGKDQPVNELAR